jgi:hypothetical protein
MILSIQPCRAARTRASDPSLTVSWDAAGGVGLRLDKDEW